MEFSALFLNILCTPHLLLSMEEPWCVCIDMGNNRLEFYLKLFFKMLEIIDSVSPFSEMI